MNDRGHLSTTFTTPGADPPPIEPGLQKLGLGSRRDSYVYVPQAYLPEQPQAGLPHRFGCTTLIRLARLVE